MVSGRSLKGCENVVLFFAGSLPARVTGAHIVVGAGGIT